MVPLTLHFRVWEAILGHFDTGRGFVRFRAPLDGAPQQTSCEESVARLLSFTMGSTIESLHCQGHYMYWGDMYQPRFVFDT